MRVLLVNTNRIRPPVAPIALDYIGSALRAGGHATELLDLCWSDEPAASIAAALSGNGFGAVALSFRNTDDCYFVSRTSFLQTLKQDVEHVRKSFDGPLLIGGGGFSVMPREILAYVGESYGAVGDGERAICRFLGALRGSLSFDNVPGLVYRQDGRWRQNPPDHHDLADLELSDRRTVDNVRYFELGGQMGIESKRGCPGRCIYCADPVIKGNATRTREPAQIAAELLNLATRGIDTFHFCDSEFNIPYGHAISVCRAISGAGLGDRIRWYVYASPIPFSSELGRAMKRAGCAGINFGVDSGCERQLQALGRSYGPEALGRAAAVCRENDMAVMFDLLVGAPGETWDSVRQTMELVKHIGPDRVGVSLGVRVYPGTRLAEELACGRVDGQGLEGAMGGTEPVYYMSPDLGPDPEQELGELIGRDPRFLLPSTGDQQDYNYNDNALLENAIKAGHRGAYWDILRKL